MSRTDKDLPYWYAEYYEPSHHCGEFGTSYWDKHKDKDCDLPLLTYKELRKGGYWGNRRTHTCYWVPIKDKAYRNWYDRNPRWWMESAWENPVRTYVRDSARKALQDYNANGDTEIDIANFRRKHEGGWFW